MKFNDSISKSVILLAVLFFIPVIISNGQDTQDKATAPAPVSYKSLSLIYIDNSKFTAKDGLTTEMTEKIKSVNDALKDFPDNKYVMLISNGHAAQPSTKFTSSTEILEKIYRGASEFPNKSEDQSKLDSALFGEPFIVTGTAQLHYFITDQFCKSLMEQPKDIITGLAQKIKFLGNITSEIIVNLYYSNRTGIIDEKSFVAEYEFYNHPKVKSGIVMNLIKL